MDVDTTDVDPMDIDSYWTSKPGWTKAEDQLLFHSRRSGMTWKDIAKSLPGRTTGACRSHYSAIAGEKSKRPPSQRWALQEDQALVRLRLSGMTWEVISARLPGRTPMSCSARYSGVLEKRPWNDQMKNDLARLYQKCVTYPTF